MSIINLVPENYWMLNWLDQFLVGHKGFICGGCFKNIFERQPVKDLDIFFRDLNDWENACFYFDERTAGYTQFEDDMPLREADAEYIFHYENDKVKSYKHKKTGVCIELCKAIFGEPKDVIKQFDFTITKFAYYKATITESGEELTAVDAQVNLTKDDPEETHIETRIICVDTFFEHLHMKRLVIDDEIPFPMSTFERTLRYVKYGYGMCKESKLKLATAINELPLETIDTNNSLYDGMD